jgi:hypothetical protein
MAFFGPWANELCAHLQNPLLKTLKTIHDKKFADQPWLFGSWSTNVQPTSKKELLKKKSKFGSSKFDQSCVFKFMV